MKCEHWHKYWPTAGWGPVTVMVPLFNWYTMVHIFLIGDGNGWKRVPTFTWELCPALASDPQTFHHGSVASGNHG